jgi:methyl-CpG-binding domain protein 4
MMVGMLHRKIIRPLLQEIYQPDGWKMLTCCMLLNLTNRKQVDTIRDELFSKYPTPKDMMNANQSELAELLKPLGLYNRRAKSLKKMSEGYVKGFKSVDELYGIGQYAKDSWEIFQNNNKNVNPTDKVLLAYLDMEM